MAKARDLIFFGYSGSTEPTGAVERDGSFFLVAQTLKLHLQRRFPDDVIDVICAWHKDTFVNALRTPAADPALKVRQIHYVGHGFNGGLYFGYKNAVAVKARGDLLAFLSVLPSMFVSDVVKRHMALTQDAGLMTGFFNDALPAAKLAEIKAQLRPDALLHVWGCFAGAPTHTFDTSPYWNLFNAAGAPMDGLARHVARTLEIDATACWDPEGIHGMDFCFRDAKGVLNCSNVRPDRLPHWEWPERGARWITWDRSGTSDEKSINFLGTRVPAAQIAPGRPPGWFTNEIPLAAAKAKQPAFPACSAVPVGI